MAEPAVGVFASIPAYKTNTVTSLGLEKLIFSAQKLDAPTTFSYFQNRGSHYLVACCVDVSDLTPVSAEDLTKKYSASQGFADAVKGIKGYKYIYHATYSKTHSTRLLKAEALGDNDGGMLRLSPAAAITIDADNAKSPFSAGSTNIGLRSEVSDGKHPREVHTFSIDGKKSVFSFPEVSPE